MNSFTAIASAALLALAAGHAAAQSDVSQPKTAVSYADLDLSRASGRQVLERRLEAAVDRVCPGRPAPGELRSLEIGRKCRTQAWAGAQQQLAAIYDGRQVAEAAIKVGPGKH